MDEVVFIKHEVHSIFSFLMIREQICLTPWNRLLLLTNISPLRDMTC